jgi:DNA-3-methyladenine glycosylase I
VHAGALRNLESEPVIAAPAVSFGDESRTRYGSEQPMTETETATPGVITGEDGIARCPWAAAPPIYVDYHDTEWGMPVRGERALFERIMLEAFQSGLSWLTILRKREAFREAFADFDPDIIARFSDGDVARLMQNAGIVRNRQKIEATRTNARAVIALRAEGGLDELIWSHQPEATPAPAVPGEVPTTSPKSKALAKALKARGFVFVGPTTAHALMEAIGMIDTHLTGCHRRGSSGLFPS